MNDPHPLPGNPAETPAEAGGEARKLYRKPTFRFEPVFETMALQCGKISPTSFNCRVSSAS